MNRWTILQKVNRYYTDRLRGHGPTAQGVDWNSSDSQRLRFEQLLKILDGVGPFAINDYGCGYGALFDFLLHRGIDFTYRGFDVSRAMIEQARDQHPEHIRCRFSSNEVLLAPADYSLASGVFNVKLDSDVGEWQEYVFATIDRLAELSTRGFSFNLLTSYSDPERQRPGLYYADPCLVFDHCLKRYSDEVALLHDYGLYEFTILVKGNRAHRIQKKGREIEL